MSDRVTAHDRAVEAAAKAAGLAKPTAAVRRMVLAAFASLRADPDLREQVARAICQSHWTRFHPTHPPENFWPHPHCPKSEKEADAALTTILGGTDDPA